MNRLKTQYFVSAFILAVSAFSTLLYANDKHSNQPKLIGEGKNIHHGGHHDKKPMGVPQGNSHSKEKHAGTHHSNPHHSGHQSNKRPVETRHVDIHRTYVYRTDVHSNHGHSKPGASHHSYRFYDRHHGHNHYYPQRGYRVSVLPSRHEIIFHRGARFYFSSGVWYVSSGPQFIVTAPPIGLTVRFLPYAYTTVWYGGVPYYYANNVYYVAAPQGYRVVQPPVMLGAVTPASSPSAKAFSAMLYIYPHQDQSVEQQETDRLECHSWAVGQSGYDPDGNEISLSGGEVDYRRAISACLEGRGYTVR